MAKVQGLPIIIVMLLTLREMELTMVEAEGVLMVTEVCRETVRQVTCVFRGVLQE